MCSNVQWGLAWALKASLKASVLAASIIVSGTHKINGNFLKVMFACI